MTSTIALPPLAFLPERSYNRIPQQDLPENENSAPAQLQESHDYWPEVKKIERKEQDYLKKFETLKIDENPLYPRNDIGTAYNDDPFHKYAREFHQLRRRESLISDARSIAPESLTAFDSKLQLLNCQNGVFDLETMTFRQHSPCDKITKIARVKYDKDAVCERWLRFIDEIMCGNKENIRFLQKAIGYALTGNTKEECLFVLFGPRTRNGKSTLVETIAYLLGDYAMTIQPQTLARRNTSGSAPSPDIARLKGVRFVIMPEPAKGLELDAALVKQFTGGDTCAGRLLYKNINEYKPEFKLLINTNHLPHISDKTVFLSRRIKVIPFDRHFTEEEQDPGLKKLFCEPENMSGILNWSLLGLRMYVEEGLGMPEKVHAATEAYRAEESRTNVLAEIDGFFNENLIPAENARLKTSELHAQHVHWAMEKGLYPLTAREFVGELRRRYKVIKDMNKGNVIIGFKLKPVGAME